MPSPLSPPRTETRCSSATAPSISPLRFISVAPATKKKGDDKKKAGGGSGATQQQQQEQQQEQELKEEEEEAAKKMTRRRMRRACVRRLRAERDLAMVELLYEAALVEEASGSRERGAALLQAVLDFHLCAPHALLRGPLHSRRALSQGGRASTATATTATATAATTTATTTRVLYYCY